jgi:hypothetical protein
VRTRSKLLTAVRASKTVALVPAGVTGSKLLIAVRATALVGAVFA